MIGRRAFLVGGTGALLLPATAQAQPPGNVRRIGIIFFLPRTHRFMQAFFGGMRDLGYAEGQSFTVDYVQGDEHDASQFVRQEIARGADLIFAPVATTARAVKDATSSLPIVFAIASDPVGTGLVETLAHPGANATGLSILFAELSGKLLQLAKELVPKLRRMAVFWQPSNAGAAVNWHETERAAKTLGVELKSCGFRASRELAGVLDAARQAHVDAMAVLASPLTYGNAVRLVSFANANRIPSILVWREAVEAGGLLSYGPDIAENYRRAAGYVDRILKGAKPGDLPIEQPTKIELAVNLKTAKALGLTVPDSILLRADEVIR